MDHRPSELDPYPRGGRDLAALDLWERSLERSRQRRRLTEAGRSNRQRRRGTSMAVSAAMLAAPIVPAAGGAKGASAAPRGRGHARHVVDLRRHGRAARSCCGSATRAPPSPRSSASCAIAADGIFGPITQRVGRGVPARARAGGDRHRRRPHVGRSCSTGACCSTTSRARRRRPARAGGRRCEWSSPTTRRGRRRRCRGPPEGDGAAPAPTCGSPPAVPRRRRTTRAATCPRPAEAAPSRRRPRRRRRPPEPPRPRRRPGRRRLHDGHACAPGPGHRDRPLRRRPRRPPPRRPRHRRAERARRARSAVRHRQRSPAASATTG